MTKLKSPSRGEAVELLQELLNQLGYSLVVDGIFGRLTDAAVRDFQLRNDLVSDGIVFTKTWSKLFVSTSWDEVSGRYLTEQDVAAFAKAFELEVAIVKAVQEVESRGRGFLFDGRPRILFEGHVFWRELVSRGLDPEPFRKGNEDILYRRWTRRHYLGGRREYTRLEKAQALQNSPLVVEAAQASCSWGMYQIMGFNFKEAGFDKLKSFVTEMKRSEVEQLKAFGNFIKNNRMLEHLRAKNWAAFARAYNGPSYERNRYHTKLKAAYERHAVVV